MNKVLIIFLIIAYYSIVLVNCQRPDSCNTPPVTGPCRGYFPRYGFDSVSGQCKQFIYGGCNGNGNNFETEEECMDQCVNSES